ncbi:RHS repeat domain-containing protein [Pseudoxanthomonas winnipegensis]|uniref:RHS repeat domain-containing protein n=1 Tax=Pseudoxanthomonas winnipegensis TaxID=2480810 RepID=UPI003CCFE031
MKTSSAMSGQAGNWLIWCMLALWCACAGMPAKAQTVEYIHTDALGSPIAVTNANQQVIERSEYAPYGDLLNRPDTDGPGFTGHVLDAATGMSYMQQRYYDPSLGRFLSVDPVTAYNDPNGSFSRYWYANNNPYRFADPDGRQVSDPRSCHSDNSCRTLEQAQEGIGQDGVLLMKGLALSAGIGAGSAVAVESGAASAVATVATNKARRKIAKEVLCTALSLGDCSGKEQMKHPAEPRPEGQRVEDAVRMVESVKRWLRRNLGQQPGPPPPKPTPQPNAPNPSPQPSPPIPKPVPPKPAEM